MKGDRTCVYFVTAYLMLIAESEESLRENIVKWKFGMIVKRSKMNTKFGFVKVGRVRIAMQCLRRSENYRDWNQSVSLSRKLA